MQTLFYCEISFRERFLKGFYLLLVIIIALCLPLFFLRVNQVTLFFGSMYLCMLIIYSLILRHECIYWIQELSFLNDSNRLKIVYYKFDERVDLEGDLSEFEFYLMVGNGRNSWKMKIVDRNKHNIEQFEMLEWNKKKMKAFIREIYKRGGNVKNKVMTLSMLKKFLEGQE